MQIGPRHWQMVTCDSAGVPRGGIYGNVERFIREAAKLGCHVGWSRLRDCFIVYTIVQGHKYVCQLGCVTPRGQVIPLNDELLGWLRSCQAGFARQNNSMIMAKVEQADRDRKSRDAAEAQQRIEDCRREGVELAERQLGKSAPLISIPHRLAIHHGRH